METSTHNDFHIVTGMIGAFIRTVARHQLDYIIRSVRHHYIFTIASDSLNVEYCCAPGDDLLFAIIDQCELIIRQLPFWTPTIFGLFGRVTLLK